ncbi:hypothetical protein [Treponema endosymbiont of Eucomonympha sp.]|uniref:hypothetical protein n=1 Tax=Treponema endosymbiont of Eucomonympha sp. TaxID=1580831 RepID=UPI000750A06E|nr:hypothetical protein [Treponema endosymbiont of Eucomonympha sp.]
MRALLFTRAQCADCVRLARTRFPPDAQALLDGAERVDVDTETGLSRAAPYRLQRVPALVTGGSVYAGFDAIKRFFAG